MAGAAVSVDLLNPGQVFACLGLMEAAEILCGPCEGGFDYREFETQTTFAIHVAGAEDPIAAVVKFLASAEVNTNPLRC